ncbi:MAG TPA: AraC family transcriptional regulator [Chthoniobacteraceae bacterium]|nr:AraC family transcriptional regulator [Chthoniobacteraceae bacterium]
MTASNYSRYLPPSPETVRWGLGLTGAGFASIPPGSSYPPRHHPADHDFDWEHGRVLEGLQVLLITRGGGELETAAMACMRVEAGMAFLILPGEWHRYRPDPATGWDESWIEIAGPVMDGLLESGTFSRGSIIKPDALGMGLDEVFEAIHRRMLAPPGGFEPELSAAALRVLALCARIDSTRVPHIRRAVRSAEQYLAAHHAEPVNMEALARRLGVAYSHFRRAFRKQTGFSPWQYVIRLRLSRARRLLAASDATLDDIAARVGFSTAFHLSLAFKRAYGQAPHYWRQALSRERR